MFDDDEQEPSPRGELIIQTIPLPADTNSFGDVHGGWLVSQMDLAASATATQVAHGRVATVAMNSMAFLTPVSVGSSVSFYTDVIDVGRSSIRIQLEVWTRKSAELSLRKVTEGVFIFVAIDQQGRTRQINKN